MTLYDVIRYLCNKTFNKNMLEIVKKFEHWQKPWIVNLELKWTQSVAFKKKLMLCWTNTSLLLFQISHYWDFHVTQIYYEATVGPQLLINFAKALIWWKICINIIFYQILWYCNLTWVINLRECLNLNIIMAKL